MGEANSGKMSLKLIVDRNAKRVIFGEAGKEFVDFLFNFLSLPVGRVVKLLSKDKMVGSLGKIYESIEAMQANYMEPNVKNIGDTDGCCLSYMSSNPEAICPTCNECMDFELTNVQGPGKEAAKVEKGTGYVKGLVTYMVMDDLIVKPMSTVSSITLLSTFKVKDLGSLETVEVLIGKEEAGDMLKASFLTDKVLTLLFLGGTKKA
ncbi:uncharacterized protein LOC141691229 [Apium graveolens]|uniref:uncharacterized protein LOC141691229 n=1 Tax=Apium graveolens TaxID=4045 RepID=UPI003D7C07D9